MVQEEILMKKTALTILVCIFLTCVYGQQPTDYTTAEINTINTDRSAAEGNLYHDAGLDIFYIGVTDGSLKELGTVISRGATDEDVLSWNTSTNQWEATPPTIAGITLEKTIINNIKRARVKLQAFNNINQTSYTVIPESFEFNQTLATISDNKLTNLEGKLNFIVQPNFLSAALNVNVNCILYKNNTAVQKVFGSNYISNNNNHNTSSSSFTFLIEDIVRSDIIHFVFEREANTGFTELVSDGIETSFIFIEESTDLEIITNVTAPLNLSIAQGPPGPRGPRGAQGNQGPAGSSVIIKPYITSASRTQIPTNQTEYKITIFGQNFDTNTLFEIIDGDLTNLIITNTEVLSPTQVQLTFTSTGLEDSYLLRAYNNGNSHFGVDITLDVVDKIVLIPGDNVAWENETFGIEVGNGTMRTTVPNGGWNKQATFGSVPANTDCILEFRYAGRGINSTRDAYAMIGLTIDPTANTSYTTIDHAIYLRNGADVYIYENGSSRGRRSVTLNDGDFFEIKRTGTTITYHQNGTLIYTSLVPSTGELFYDSSVHLSVSLLDIKLSYE